MVKNFLILSVLQISGFIFPLISLPYLAKTLGIQMLGVYSLFQSVTVITSVIADYGYITNGTQRISTIKGNSKKISIIINNALYLRLNIAIAASFCGAAYLFSVIPKGMQTLPNLLTVVVATVLSSLNLPWVFQGLEKMPQYSAILIAGRTFSLMLILALVSGPANLQTALWVSLLPQLIGAVFSIFYISKYLNWKFKVPRILDAKLELIYGWNFFTPNFYSIFFTQVGLIALGMYQSQMVVGGYAVMDRIAKAVGSLNGAVNQAVYPQVAFAMSQSHSIGVAVLRKYALIFLPPALVLSLILAFYSPTIVSIFFGETYVPFSDALRYLSIFIFLSSVNTFIGVIYMNTSGRQREYSRATLVGTLVALVLYFSLPALIGYYAPVFGIILGESLIIVIILSSIFKKRNKNV
ncbi:teichoic acid transporter [Deinococcus aerophilus]|uniref:Teichoic acid transporter n=2 Tax=Deinococcus aerophilus TaxID=522488 RepID=A0ABQ2GZB4_9DEIO|nr:teichoic acid transporter [Deinococcus aerophilus]